PRQHEIGGSRSGERTTPPGDRAALPTPSDPPDEDAGDDAIALPCGCTAVERRLARNRSKRTAQQGVGPSRGTFNNTPAGPFRGERQPCSSWLRRALERRPATDLHGQLIALAAYAVRAAAV